MIKQIQSLQVILFVSNQQVSCEFYKKLFRTEPILDVPGMTEFQLFNNCKLGLMPNKGIAKILDKHTPQPDDGQGIPRCELYIHVDNLQKEFDHALALGAQLISPISPRDWGDNAGYVADPDMHIIAFAEKQI